MNDTSLKAQMAFDPWMWALESNIKLTKGTFRIEGHEYQAEIIRGWSEEYPFNGLFEVNMKATQMVFTESYVLRILHALRNKKYPLGVIYFMPTRDDVIDFSDSRFKPLIDDNHEEIGQYVRDTNRANLKRIGRAYLYFRGGKISQAIEGEIRTSSRVKGVPADGFVCDEWDEMDQEIRELALGRLQHSDIKFQIYLANPTMPNYGIHKLYLQSDQRVWMIKCEHCGEWTSLDLEFPNCLKRIKAGDNYQVIRACKKCEKEIYPRDGQWIPQYPDKSKDCCGRWIGHPNSVFVDPAELLKAWEDPELKKGSFYNLRLGLPYISTENRLNINDVYDCCSWYPMEGSHPGPCAMGVDVQGETKGNRVIIGCKTNNSTYKILKLARLSGFDDILDLGKRFHVGCAVFDIEPETRKVKDLAENAPFPVYMCDYKKTQRNDPAFDSKQHIVTINRTDICDATHDLVSADYVHKRLVIPRKNKEVEVFAKEICNIAKTLIEDKKTGHREYGYLILEGRDDYRHALNYYYLAQMKVGISHAERRKAVISKDKWDKAFADNQKSVGGWMGA